MLFAEKPVRSVREQIVDTLRAEVLGGAWDNNAPVREQALAERFGVSRGPIRDALQELSREGVLTYQPNKGVRVNKPPVGAERQLLQSMRREMETFCLSQCMDQLTGSDDDQLQLILHDLIRACSRGEVSAIADSDLSLHRFLIRSASKELEIVWQSIASRVLMDYTRCECYDEVVQEHTSIVEAVINRDLESAHQGFSRTSFEMHLFKRVLFLQLFFWQILLADEGEQLFSLKVRNILSSKCYACHGGDPSKIKGGLDLTSLRGMLKGGESGLSSLLPGKPLESPLYIASARNNDDEWSVMPPKENDKLSKQLIALKRWIDLGAPWPDKKTQLRYVANERVKRVTEDGILMETSGGLSDDWTYRRYNPEDIWAFMPVKKPKLPIGGLNPVDSFIRSKREKKRLSPPLKLTSEIW